ncbi:MAG: flagellar biosynthetic protein FliR [Parvularcula sp.]
MTPFLRELAGAAELADGALFPFLAILTRLSGVLLVMPGIGMRIIPVRIKVFIALLLSFAMLPAVLPYYPPSVQSPTLLIGEFVIGSFYGFFVRTYVFALSIAGAIIAQSLSLSQIFGAGVSEEANTTVSTLLTMAGTSLFLSLGLHFTVFGVLLTSLDIFHPTANFLAIPAGEFASYATRFARDAFSLAISISLPFLLLNLCVNSLLGVLNRAMPQLMVTFVGLPGITLSGILLLVVGISALLSRWALSLETGLSGFLS